ncbi:hypothetical protein Plhal304r1_c003g0009791 [Plasmopara halstedii]
MSWYQYHFCSLQVYPCMGPEKSIPAVVFENDEVNKKARLVEKNSLSIMSNPINITRKGLSAWSEMTVRIWRQEFHHAIDPHRGMCRDADPVPDCICCVTRQYHLLKNIVMS